MNSDNAFASLSSEKRREIIDLAAGSKNEAELGEKLRNAGFEISEEAIKALFSRVNTPPPLGDLSDEELENVSGGCGCSHCDQCVGHQRPDV